MQVVLERVDERRYLIGVVRDGAHDTGADVPLRIGPGSGSADTPHDLVHLAIEEALGLRLGIFGQVAAGGDCGGFFVPAPADRSGVRDRKRSARLARAGRADAERSERLAALVDHDGHLHRDRAGDLADARELDRVERRLREVLDAWRSTPPGGRLHLTWPDRLTVRRGVLPHAG